MTLKEQVGEKWLESCDKKILNQFKKIDNNFKLVPDFDDEIATATFFKYNGTNISPKHAELVSVVLEKFDVIGIWKKHMYAGTIDSVTCVELYGYSRDVQLCHNMLHFLLDGFDRYFDNHVKELRRKRHLRRMQCIRIINEIDARRRTNTNIANKVKVLVKLISEHPRILRMPYGHPYGQKKKNILKVLLSYEKVDYKKYRGQKEPTLKTMYSRIGHIQLNRLV